MLYTQLCFVVVDAAPALKTPAALNVIKLDIYIFLIYLMRTMQCHELNEWQVNRDVVRFGGRALQCLACKEQNLNCLHWELVRVLFFLKKVTEFEKGCFLCVFPPILGEGVPECTAYRGS